jgi:hypothetical protein
MAASYLISDCLRLIFSNLLVKYPINYNNYIYISTKDIHSCTLVSKHWCNTSTPFLYAYPFHHLVYLNFQWEECPFHYLANSNSQWNEPIPYAYPFHDLVYLNFQWDKCPFHYLANSKSQWNECSSYYKLIRTLLSCIPKPEIEQIKLSSFSNIQKLLSYFYYFLNKTLSSTPTPSTPIPSPSTPTSSTFNYITFIRGIIFDKVLLNINLSKIIRNQRIWLPPYIIHDFKDHDTVLEKGWHSHQLSKISIPIMKYFVEYLCKHCNNLIMLDFPFAISNDDLSDNIIKLLTSKDNNKLTNLKKLCIINNEDISKVKRKLPMDLYSALSKSTPNLNLLYNEKVGSAREANSLSRFISLQKNLQHIILSDNGRHTTRNYNVVFKSLSTQSECLHKLELKYLILDNINEEALKSLCLLKNIKELNLYRCVGINNNLIRWANSLTKLVILELYAYCISPMSETFLVRLIQSSSNTLTKLILNYDRSVGDHLIQQIPLYLHSLIHLGLPKVLPDVLISIFKSCTRLIYLSAVLSDEYIFRNLGKFIPENLQKIRFGYEDYPSLSSTELKSFFEECKNNHSKLELIEIVNCEIDDECFNVAKEFGVELRSI